MARYRTRSQVVVDALRRDILWGNLEPGRRLSQDDLAAHYGVSRIPVREALRILSAEGLVQLTPHREARVWLHSADEIGELWWIRELLEPEAARLAAPHLTPALMRSLDGIQARLEALGAVPDLAQWLALNRSFHLAIYKAAGRPQLLRLITELFDRSVRYIRVYLKSGEQFEQADAEHRAILEACRARDAEALARLTAEHIRHGAGWLRLALDAPPVPEAAPRKSRR
jgi:DNA-binding GntR family transcriptional regulator